MAKVALTRAAELTGKSPSTIHRAMRKGRLSYETDEHGARLVDVSELERAFGLVSQSSSSRDGVAQLQQAGTQSHELHVEIEVSRFKIASLEERMRELALQRDEMRHDRDRWRSQAERLLTDQRETVTPTSSPRRRRWWQFRARS
jgi:hypothetical protein